MILANRQDSVLIYSIHRSEAWWRYVGKNLGFSRSAVVSDLRGEGDFNVVDDFYAAYHRWRARPNLASPLIDADRLKEVIARCRVLRWLPRAKAQSMVFAWAEVLDKVLVQAEPTIMLCWSLDRYISDILALLSEVRGIKFYELGVSPIPDAVMLMRRGALLTRETPIDTAQLDAIIHTITDSLFAPSYVAGSINYSVSRWWRIFCYFKLRGVAFRMISILKRDPLNLHYLDAQSFLGHKPRVDDVRILGMFDADWQSRIHQTPEDRRLFLPLQLFPEASIDYWISDLSLIDHENLLVQVATVFADAGYIIVVKDHPLQFGFRQKELIDRLKSISGVVFAPYEISGNILLKECSVVFTCTGTLGMQAALVGKTAITTPTYFTTPDDFVVLNSREGIAALPSRVASFPRLSGAALIERQRRIVSHLMSGSYFSDYYAFRTFNASKGQKTHESDRLAQVVGAAMLEVDL